MRVYENSLLIILACSVFASNCNAPSLVNVKDCSGASAIKQVIQLARDNPAIATKIADSLPSIAAENPAVPLTADELYKAYPQHQGIADQMSALNLQVEQKIALCHTLFPQDERDPSDVCLEGGGGEKYPPWPKENIEPLRDQIAALSDQLRDVDLQIERQRADKYKSDIARILNAVVYTLKDTTLTDKDAETGNVKCSATLAVSVPQADESHSPVTYKVEETSEGKANVTVYGLTPDE